MYIHSVAKGVKLNAAEARVGPHVLAGFRDAPDMGPNIQMDAARTSPMATPAHDWSAFLSVAPNIVNTRMAVAITSASSAAPIVNPDPGVVSPRKVVFATSYVLLDDDHKASWTSPATVAPNSWAIMYGATLRGSILLVAQDAIVTAGLMCAPEMCPIEYTATNNATPWASPMTPNPAAVDPNPAKLVAVMVPGPTRVRRNVP